MRLKCLAIGPLPMHLTIEPSIRGVSHVVVSLSIILLCSISSASSLCKLFPGDGQVQIRVNQVSEPEEIIGNFNQSLFPFHFFTFFTFVFISVFWFFAQSNSFFSPVPLNL